MKSLKLWSWAVVVAMLSAIGSAGASEAQADWATTLQVKLALLSKLGTDSLHIDVDTSESRVELSGTVEKRETAELATGIARSVDGVAAVENELRVEPRPGEAGTAGSALAEAEAEVQDAILETKIRIAFLDQLGTDGFKVGTEAASGVVTLEFDPATPAELRQKAMAAARGVEGVGKVVSVERRS
jgi:osmotically-inducible protein OsmY